ncbi:metallophosphoesterase [Paenibacillus sp. BSR1-1]|uniref:metallophosphoesterase family protein n=1 Tax=Paenibacillus sp. BSR1-1 TaxID=3020845 RepID=UPI0025B12E21|nr:metallophosphoesterase [Paenibacillus sp. BSR1-1]MDN3016334.1 metallophosphoesterase [Paenibacillus sp. BSR1-1]
MLKFIISIFLAMDVFGFHQVPSEQSQTKTGTQQQKQSTETTENVQQVVAKQQDETDDTNPDLQLAVISDTHISTTKQSVVKKFETALQDLNTVAPEYDVLAVGGDMTDHGLSSEYDLFNSVLKANMNQNASTFMVIGNHEWMEKKVNRNSNVTDSQLIERFKSKMNVPGIYYDQSIQGYHFITIAGEKSESTMLSTYKNEADADSAYISDEQFNWLEQTLANDAKSTKPIFVFLHQPITGTVYGSEWGAGLEDQKILALLKKYPQVILFSGHSHYPLNDSSSIVQDGITMVNTSSVAYTYTKGTGKNTVQSQGYVVNVYDDRVEFKAREFSTGTWIKTVTIPISKANQLN